MEIKRIAIIYPYLSGRGGSQRYVLEIAKQLIELGMEVEIFCYYLNRKSCYPNLLEKIKINALHDTFDKIENENVFLSYKTKIFSFIFKFFLLKFLFYTLGINYLLSLFQTKKKSKEFSRYLKNLNIHKNFELLYVHEEPLSLYTSICIKKEFNIPIYWFCYDTISKWFIDWEKKQFGHTLRKFILEKIYFKYDRYLVRSNVDLVSVLDKFVKIKFEKMYGYSPIIRKGGVDNEILSLERSNYLHEKLNLSNDYILITCVSRFLPYKQIEDFFELKRILDKNSNLKTAFYLNAPISNLNYYNEVVEKYHDVVSSKSFFVDTNNFSTDIELQNVYLSSNIFIFPNINQTWGNAPLEAMALGCLAFVSKGCGISNEICDISPTVFSSGDIEELSKKILNIVNNNKINFYAAVQKKNVEDNLNWKVLCPQLILDFGDIINKFKYN